MLQPLYQTSSFVWSLDTGNLLIFLLVHSHQSFLTVAHYVMGFNQTTLMESRQLLAIWAINDLDHA